MFSYPTDQQVTADLGSKFLTRFVDAVDSARDDFVAFRQWRPAWFSTFTNRFTSNFIHERIWAHLIAGLDDDSDLVVTDKEPRRDLTYAGRYIMRIKRHSSSDQIRTYPTSSAIEFWSHKITFDGLEKISLALGYLWDADERAIKAPVLSFRDGKDNPIWAIRFHGRGAAQPIAWEPVEPTDPTLDLSTILRPEGEAGESDT